MLHTSTTEFLRQLYAAILPAPPASSLPSSISGAGSTSYHLGARLTDAERRDKASKMVGFLRKVRLKADALVGACAADDERERVRMALKTTLESVDKALAFHQSRRR